MRKLFLFLIAVILVGALIFSGCGKPAPAPAAKPIVIAQLENWTGPETGVTPFLVNALELALDEYNWQVAGRPIKVVREDCAGDPTIAADKVRKVVEVDKANLVIGPLLTPSLVAVSTYLSKVGTPHIWGIYGLEEMAKLGDNIFLPHGTLQLSGYLTGEYAAKVKGYKTAAVIHDDFAGGETMTQGGMDGFVVNGGKILQRLRTPMDALEYSPYITKLEKADVVFNWFLPFHTQRFVAQAHEFGLKMPIIQTGSFTMGNPMLAELGDKGVGIIGTNAFDAGVETPAVKAYIDKWVKKYGNLPADKGNYPGYAEGDCVYVSTLVALEGLKAANGDTTPAVLNKAIQNVKVQTPWGPLSFDKDGIGIGPSFIVETVKDTKDGKPWYHRKGIYTFEVRPLRQDPATAMKAPKM